MLPILFNLHNILFSKEECIEFLLENEVLYQSATCTNYHRPMIRYYAKWKCLKRHTINQGQSPETRFSSNANCLAIKCCWLTICGWQNLPHPLYKKWLATQHQQSPKLLVYLDNLWLVTWMSRPQERIAWLVVMEIDKSKFFNPHTTSSRTNAQVGWVFREVERTEKRRLFIEYAQDRSADILLPIIHRRVYPESIIFSDCWMTYSNIQPQLGIQDFNINHSRLFVDPLSDAYINTIEDTWHSLKLAISQKEMSKSKISEYLLEFIWRRKN